LQERKKEKRKDRIMTRKLIVFCLALSFIVSLPAKDVKESSPSVRSSGKDLHELSLDGNISPVAMSQDGEVIPLANPVIRRAFNNNARGLVDTLDWGVGGTVNFGFFPGDIMVEWYKAPTDLTLYGVGVDVYVWNVDGTTPALKVEVYRPGSSGYPNGSDGATYSSTVVDGAGWLGYAHEAGNDSVDYPDPGWTTWTDPPGSDLVWNDFTNANGACGGTAPPVAASQPLMGEKVLPAGLIDATITGGADAATGLHWIDFTDDDGAEFASGEWFGVAVTYLTAGAADPSNPDARIGLLSGDFTSYVPRPGTKYYDIKCDGTSGNHGWHVRHYSWRMAYAVELTGDMPPTFTSVSALPTTLSIADRSLIAQITDTNPSGGDAGVSSATFNYQLDSLTAEVMQISLTETDTGWVCTVPGQAVGTGVYWNLTAFDGGGLNNSTMVAFYTIFEPTAGLSLVFNNQTDNPYSPGTYYLDGLAGGQYDVWQSEYGAMSDELLVNYTTVIELAGIGPDYINDDEVKAWWDGGDKTYIVSSDEWLGVRNGWANSTYAAGDFVYDVLGVAADYNDVNYGTSGDQSKASRLTAVSGDAVGGALATFLSDSSLVLNYDPKSETSGSNWLDLVDPAPGYTVAMNGYVGVIDSATQVVDDTTESGAVAIYGQAGNGGKSAFMAFDVVALNTAPLYYWVGAPHVNDYYATVYPQYGYQFLPTVDCGPLSAILTWAGGVASNDNEISLPNRFALKGNYPNPFNPSTNIAYSIDIHADVNIRVYSLLGEEIATLYNGNVIPGTHEIKWNGIDNTGAAVASGVYIYRVEANNQALTGKMMLLK
jgi:hypothetical protein